MYTEYHIEGYYLKPEYFDIIIPGEDAADALNQLKPFIPSDAENLSIESVIPEDEYEYEEEVA